MNAYLSILRSRFLTLFQYRAAAVAGLATQLFWGLLKTLILTAFYAYAPPAQPISLAQAISFVWLGQSFLHLLPWNFDREVDLLIRTGNVAYEMVKPVDLYANWFFRTLALRLAPTFLRCFPLLIAAMLFLGLQLPASMGSAAAFFVTLCMSVLLSTAISIAALITLFWTVSGEGVMRLLPTITVLLSGILLPLPLFPDWMQPFLNWQPFRGMMDIPTRFYIGLYSPSQLPQYFLFQLGWTAFFVLAGRGLLQKALRRVVIQGG